MIDGTNGPDGSSSRTTRVLPRSALRGITVKAGRSVFDRTFDTPRWPGRVNIGLEYAGGERFDLPLGGPSVNSEFSDRLAKFIPSLRDDLTT